MPKLDVDITANDQASAVIKKATENAKQGAQRIIESEKQISEATKLAARAKAEQLTLSQKMKFALAKEAAAGNKLQTQLVNEKEALAKVERKLRAAIKAGDAESSALAKQTVKLRENVKALDKKIQKEETAAVSGKTLVKILAGVTAGAAAAAAGAFLLTKRIAGQGDQMIKHAQQLGLQVEQYQKLDFAMKISGTSIEEQTGALSSFQKVARDATSGTGTAADAFALFGVTLKNNDGTMKSNNQLLLDMAEGYKNTPDGIRKSAAAMDIFGESGGKMHQFLKLGKTGIAALGIEARALGGIMSEKAAKGSEEFNDALLRLETASGGLARTMGEKMQPFFTRTLNAMAESTKALGPVWDDTFQGLVDVGRNTVLILVPIGASLASVFVGAATAALLAWETAKLSLNITFASIGGGINLLIAGFNKVNFGMQDVEPIYNAFADTAGEIADGMADITANAGATIDQIWNVADAMIGTEKVTAKSTDTQKKETEATKAQTQALKDQEAARLKLSGTLDAFVSKRAAAIDANLKLQEDWIKKNEGLQEEESDRMKALAEEILGHAVVIGEQFANSFKGVIEGTKSAGDAMEDFAKAQIATQLDVAETIIMAAAAKAATEAFAAHQWIPFVGFAVGSAAAAAAFGAAKAWLGTFAEGGIVPGVGDQAVPIMAHAGEIVLPKNLSAMLLDVVGQRGGGSMQQGGQVVAGGGGGVVVNFQDQSFMPKSPAELDLFLKNKLLPALNRLRRRGAFA